MIGVAGLTFGLGLVFGGMGPRAEVRDLQQEIFDLKRDGAQSGSGRQIADLITRGLPSRAGDGPSDRPSDRPPGRPPADGDEGAGDRQPLPSGSDEPDRVASADAADRPASPFPPEEVEAAKAAMALRAAQARAALVEDADPTPEQLAAIDLATTQMNDRLEELALQFFQQVEAEGQPDRRELYRMAADTMDAFVSAEDGILASLTPEQRAAVRQEATDPTSFVDDRVIGLLANLDQRAAEGAP